LHHSNRSTAANYFGWLAARHGNRQAIQQAGNSTGTQSTLQCPFLLDAFGSGRLQLLVRIGRLLDVAAVAVNCVLLMYGLAAMSEMAGLAEYAGIQF
jgi:hypothetical protein